MNYCVQKRVTECHAELHVTLSKHQNEMNTIKVEEHNNKSVGGNVPMAKCHKAITKQQFSIARSQNEMTGSAVCNVPIAKCQNARTK